jgi:uncharacterized membrane protein YqjE
MPSIVSALEWLEALAWTTAIRESNWGYQIMETAHVVSIVAFAGLVIVMDLRLVGVAFAHEPLTQIQRRLFPAQMAAFALSSATGLVIFCVDPLRYYGNVFFRVKIALLALAGLNALWFHMTTYRTVERWDDDPLAPATARLAGVASLLFWSAIIVSGRLVAFNWFD